MRESGVCGPGDHPWWGETGPGVLAFAHGERPGMGGVLGELWQRGLRRVLLFITDGLPGLPEAIRRVYPQAEWQRCVVHGVRWSLSQVRSRDRALLAEDLRRVYGAESREEALRAWSQPRRGYLGEVKAAWGSRYPGWWGCGYRIRGPSCGSTGTPRCFGRTYGAPT